MDRNDSKHETTESKVGGLLVHACWEPDFLESWNSRKNGTNQIIREENQTEELDIKMGDSSKKQNITMETESPEETDLISQKNTVQSVGKSVVVENSLESEKETVLKKAEKHVPCEAIDMALDIISPSCKSNAMEIDTQMLIPAIESEAKTGKNGQIGILDENTARIEDSEITTGVIENKAFEVLSFENTFEDCMNQNKEKSPTENPNLYRPGLTLEEVILGTGINVVMGDGRPNSPLSIRSHATSETWTDPELCTRELSDAVTLDASPSEMNQDQDQNNQFCIQADENLNINSTELSQQVTAADVVIADGNNSFVSTINAVKQSQELTVDEIERALGVGPGQGEGIVISMEGGKQFMILDGQIAEVLGVERNIAPKIMVAGEQQFNMLNGMVLVNDNSLNNAQKSSAGNEKVIEALLPVVHKEDAVSESVLPAFNNEHFEHQLPHIFKSIKRGRGRPRKLKSSMDSKDEFLRPTQGLIPIKEKVTNTMKGKTSRARDMLNQKCAKPSDSVTTMDYSIKATNDIGVVSDLSIEADSRIRNEYVPSEMVKDGNENYSNKFSKMDNCQFNSDLRSTQGLLSERSIASDGRSKPTSLSLSKGDKMYKDKIENISNKEKTLKMSSSKVILELKHKPTQPTSTRTVERDTFNQNTLGIQTKHVSETAQHKVVSLDILKNNHFDIDVPATIKVEHEQSTYLSTDASNELMRNHHDPRFSKSQMTNHCPTGSGDQYRLNNSSSCSNDADEHLQKNRSVVPNNDWDYYNGYNRNYQNYGQEYCSSDYNYNLQSRQTGNTDYWNQASAEQIRGHGELTHSSVGTDKGSKEIDTSDDLLSKAPIPWSSGTPKNCPIPNFTNHTGYSSLQDKDTRSSLQNTKDLPYSALFGNESSVGQDYQAQQSVHSNTYTQPTINNHNTNQKVSYPSEGGYNYQNTQAYQQYYYNYYNSNPEQFQARMKQLQQQQYFNYYNAYSQYYKQYYPHFYSQNAFSPPALQESNIDAASYQFPNHQQNLEVTQGITKDEISPDKDSTETFFANEIEEILPNRTVEIDSEDIADKSESQECVQDSLIRNESVEDIADEESRQYSDSSEENSCQFIQDYLNESESFPEVNNKITSKIDIDVDSRAIANSFQPAEVEQRPELRICNRKAATKPVERRTENNNIPAFNIQLSNNGFEISPMSFAGVSGPESPTEYMNGAARRRQRVIYTKDMLDELMSEYNRCIYLTPGARERLSNSLGLSEDRIFIWFKNQRRKDKQKMETNVIKGPIDNDNEET